MTVINTPHKSFGYESVLVVRNKLSQSKGGFTFYLHKLVYDVYLMPIMLYMFRE